MLSNISWENYTIFALLLLAIWYILIGFKFYSSNLKNLLAGKIKFTLGRANKKSSFNTAPTKNSEFSEVDDNPLIDQEETNQSFKAAEELISKLENVISNAVSKGLDKQDFILLLQATLEQYPMLKNTSFQGGINDRITKECEKYSFITLSANEMVMLWNKVK